MLQWVLVACLTTLAGVIGAKQIIAWFCHKSSHSYYATSDVVGGGDAPASVWTTIRVLDQYQINVGAMSLEKMEIQTIGIESGE